MPHDPRGEGDFRRAMQRTTMTTTTTTTTAVTVGEDDDGGGTAAVAEVRSATGALGPSPEACFEENLTSSVETLGWPTRSTVERVSSWPAADDAAALSPDKRR